jgi:hypothetical protein
MYNSFRKYAAPKTGQKLHRKIMQMDQKKTCAQGCQIFIDTIYVPKRGKTCKPNSHNITKWP